MPFLSTPPFCFPSALVEGLMGFQFNSVGGGTKTRRPIAINMKVGGALSKTWDLW